MAITEAVSGPCKQLLFSVKRSQKSQQDAWTATKPYLEQHFLETIARNIFHPILPVLCVDTPVSIIGIKYIA
jgi:hypothetical protein